MKSTVHCRGCTDDFYNGTGAKECWMLKDAKVVTRWSIGWWTPQDSAKNFRKVVTYHCHHSPGNYALMTRTIAKALLAGLGVAAWFGVLLLYGCRGLDRFAP